MAGCIAWMHQNAMISEEHAAALVAAAKAGDVKAMQSHAEASVSQARAAAARDHVALSAVCSRRPARSRLVVRRGGRGPDPDLLVVLLGCPHRAFRDSRRGHYRLRPDVAVADLRSRRSQPCAQHTRRGAHGTRRRVWAFEELNDVRRPELQPSVGVGFDVTGGARMWRFGRRDFRRTIALFRATRRSLGFLPAQAEVGLGLGAEYAKLRVSL